MVLDEVDVTIRSRCLATSPGAEILDADLNEARLVGADLSGSVIQDTFLTEADLTDATREVGRSVALTDVILYEGDRDTTADLTSQLRSSEST